MRITEMLSLIKNGKLKNFGIGEDEVTILGFINLGLIEMYKRFPLDVKECMITLQDGKTIYDMPSDYMWVVSAYGEVPDGSIELVDVLPINEEDNPKSVNTIGFNKIQVPVVTTGSYISIIYVAAPPYIVKRDVDDYYYVDVNGVEVCINDVPLPPQMVGALLDYVAYEAHDTLPNPDGLMSTAYQKFEASCEKILAKGMFNTDDLDMESRHMKGFA